MTANTIKLINLKYIDMYHFQMWEGKFQDLEQNTPTFIYANVSNFETKAFEDSDVRVYAHSYEDLYSPEDYELRVPDDVERKIKEVILAELFKKPEYAHKATELCPECDAWSSVENWKPSDGYIATCKNCGSKMFMCDECGLAHDNPYGKCDWHKEMINGEQYSCCFRGRYKMSEQMRVPYPVVYSSDYVTICSVGNVLYAYKPTHNEKAEWERCESSWRVEDGKYFQTDGLGRMTGVVVDTYEELVDVVRKEER